jgi:serine/threonine protein kinase
VRLLGLESEAVRALPEADAVETAVGAPAPGGAALLDGATLPARPTASSSLPPAGVVAAGRPTGGAAGFDSEETAEWTLDQAKESLAGVGEDSHVIGGRYRIIEGLAMGGMGAVFKVKHLELGKEFALKIIHSSLSEDVNMQRFFFREARILSQLDHPNIVDVTDFGSDDRFGAYLVMEYLKGESLHAHLDREARLAVPQALAVALQVAEALHSMHTDDLVHCDIKPENIFLTRTPAGRRKRIAAKLIDFGLSRNMALGAELDKIEVGGTPIYAAPEQIQGLAPQASMDIYAVGELLYHMLTGQPPFIGSIPEICADKLSKPPAKPSAVPSSGTTEALDPQIEALIMKSLALRPADRQDSMAQLVFELRAVSDMLQTSPAFERLAATVGKPALGQHLSSTKLGNIYPQIDADVINAVAQKTPLQRTIKFRSNMDQAAVLMIWLVPRMDASDRVIHLWGVVVPG